MQPPQNNKIKSPRRFLRLSCSAFGVLLIVGCIFALYSVIYFNKSRFIANQSDEVDTTRAFAYSLAYNKLDNVKTHVSEDKWGFIDSWTLNHEAVSTECKNWDYPWEPDMVGVCDPESNFCLVAYWIDCTCPEYSYTFMVNANIEFRNKKWEITGWTDICEIKGEVEKCY